MNENFIAYIWQYKLFNHHNLTSYNSETLNIIHVGTRNTLSGPDFFNAKVIIENTLWAGNIEIHVKSSDWLLHKHQNDKAYDNVILHVVFENDAPPIHRSNGSEICTLVLKSRINEAIYANYEYLLHNLDWIACAKLVYTLDSFTVSHCLSQMLAERIEQKVLPILSSLKNNQNSWEETFYELLLKGFGTNANSFAFEQLAKNLPIAILAKHRNNLLQLEALLFGQAGLLQKNFIDPYPIALKKEYTYLKHKFNLTPLLEGVFKTGGLRPSNFPTIRLSQFAVLVHQSHGLFSRVIEAQTIADLNALISTSTSEYWQTHYVFDKPARKQIKQVGKNMLYLIIINTICPTLFAYGRQKNEVEMEQKALNLLEKLPTESNSIIDNWEKLGIKSNSAFDSQALIQLKNNYCAYKKCLQCSIGNKLIRNNIPNTL